MMNQPAIGEVVKVHLPGESPWAECIGKSADGTWLGVIKNRLVNEMTEFEIARFLKREFGTVKFPPRLHDFKCGDTVRFEHDGKFDIWVPTRPTESPKP